MTKRNWYPYPERLRIPVPLSLLIRYTEPEDPPKVNRSPWCAYAARSAPQSVKQLERESEAALRLYEAIMKD